MSSASLAIATGMDFEKLERRAKALEEGLRAALAELERQSHDPAATAEEGIQVARMGRALLAHLSPKVAP